MSSPLAKAIDAPVAFVDAREFIANGDEYLEFARLDRAVWEEAYRAGLTDALPEPIEGEAIGRTRLPVMSIIGGNYPAAKRWRVDMLMLRSLAEPQDLPPDGAKVEPEDVPAAFRAKKKPDGPISNSAYLLDNPVD